VAVDPVEADAILPFLVEVDEVGVYVAVPL
jgi:hypothetical protein